MLGPPKQGDTQAVKYSQMYMFTQQSCQIEPDDPTSRQAQPNLVPAESKRKSGTYVSVKQGAVLDSRSQGHGAPASPGAEDEPSLRSGVSSTEEKCLDAF